MKKLNLTDRQAIQLRSILKYAYNKYRESEHTNDATELSMLELLTLIKKEL